MSFEYEETIEFYKNLNVSIGGIPKKEVPQRAHVNMGDAELVAFYSEQYVDVDVAEFLTKERKERLSGLCNLVKQGEFYLDVGCANGAHMEILHQKNISGIGLDLSIPNILRGRQKYPHLKFIHGFAEAIPFKDNYFDIVVLGDIIEHFRDPKASLAECLRVARKGLALCVPIKPEVTAEHINSFSCEKILKLLNFYGLKMHFYDYEGRQISLADAGSTLQAFSWLFIRAEKTEQTNSVGREITNREGEKGRRQAMNWLAANDEWLQNIEHQREETHLARFKLLSHLIEGQKVLEVGCGNGDLSVATAKLGFDVVGVDISEPGVRQAIELAKKENLKAKAQFKLMDAARLKFADNSFDSVIIPEVLEHVRDSKKLMEEAIRVVRNGGRIVISVPNGLLIPFRGHLRVFFKDTLETEIIQHTSEIRWHELPFRKWLICSFFVKKDALNILEGPVVDILMPTYNGRRYIRNAIKSILSQTYRNWTLVVVNDGGEDVRDILEEFHDDRIKYIITEHKGKAGALNVGVESSTGEFISYLDDDDILYPMHLEILIKAALEGKKDFVYSDWLEVARDKDDREIDRKIEIRQDVTPWLLIRQNYINHKCILHSRRLLEKTGMYDEELDVLIDWDMTRRLAFICKPHHVWGVTSEHLRYYDKTEITNRITGLWTRSPDKALRSLERIVNKTMNLPAKPKELKKAVIDAMLHQSYFHSLELDNAVQVKNSLISDLERNLQEKSSHIGKLEAIISERSDQISRLEGVSKKKDGEIGSLNETIRKRGAEIEHLEVSLAESERELGSRNEDLRQKETQIFHLEEVVGDKNAALNHIYNSSGWKTLLIYYRWRDKIFPINTKRRLLAKIILKTIKDPGGIFKIVNRANRRKYFSYFTSAEPSVLEKEAEREIAEVSEISKTGDVLEKFDKQYEEIFESPQRDIRSGLDNVEEYGKKYDQSIRIDNIRIIAFYLPQFHPIPENDRWWGKGFTDWTNVVKATPNFIGHYQPHLPSDLGFYDLRMPEVREQQAELAREHGIYGFCYHHYWFNGRRLLERPFNEVLKSGRPNFPFCLCWANENWTRRWDGLEHDILIAQEYSERDSVAFIRDLVPAFRDDRYIRINGKPLLIVYRVNLLPKPQMTAEIWRAECRRLGVGEIYLCAAQSFGITDPRPYGFDAAVEFPPHSLFVPEIINKVSITNPNFTGHIFDYEEAVHFMEKKKATKYTLFKAVMPSWDNTPRKQNTSHIIAHATPDLYKGWLADIIEYTKKHLSGDERLVFINAWNEWGEGAHLEPDRKYGDAFLKATKSVIEKSDFSHKRQKARRRSPLVSVVIPSYNHEKFIREAIRSVYEQTFRDLELIIVDDGSTDGSLKVIEEAVKRNGGVKTKIFSQRNKGAHKAINLGIRRAKGHFINILNSDDKFNVERIEVFVNKLERTGGRIAFSKVGVIDDNSVDISHSHSSGLVFSEKQQQASLFPSIGFALLDFNVAISSGNLFFEKSLFFEVGGFKGLKYCHDWDFVLGALRFTEPLFIKEVLYLYRIHQDNAFLSLKDLGDQESKIVLSKAFEVVGNRTLRNPKYPCKDNYPTYFEKFVSERGYDCYLPK